MNQKLFGASSVATAENRPFTMVVTMVLWSLAAIYVLGTLVDFAILWIVQRQPGTQWEFVAVTRTVEGWPRLLLGVGAAVLALHIGGRESPGAFSILGAFLTALGVGGAVMGLLTVLQYTPLAEVADAAGAEVLSSAMLKSLVLCALYFLLLTPAGIIALLRGRRARR